MAELKINRTEQECRANNYSCDSCYWGFLLNMCSDNTPHPLYCPKCGVKLDCGKTPTQIVEEIKSIYHGTPHAHCLIDSEDKMTKLLNELKEMAEEKK